MTLIISHESWDKECELEDNDIIINYAENIIDPYPIEWNDDAPEIGKICYLLHLLTYECGIRIRVKGDKNHATNNTIRS